ncbi:MAG: sigma-70 family RNA polymerase sigma factor [bacterium]
MNHNYKQLFEDWEIGITKKIINDSLDKSSYLTNEDFEDLLQECLTHWYFNKGGYDPKKEASKKTFMARIIKNKLVDIIREKQAEKRKINNLAISLEAPIGRGEDAPPLIEKIDEHITIDAFHNSSIEIQLKIDLSNALHYLTPKQKKLCQLLQDNSITEISDCLKTPRSTIYDEIKRIKNIFEKQGLEEYLK